MILKVACEVVRDFILMLLFIDVLAVYKNFQLYFEAWMDRCLGGFTSFLKVFVAYQDNGRVILKDSSIKLCQGLDKNHKQTDLVLVSLTNYFFQCAYSFGACPCYSKFSEPYFTLIRQRISTRQTESQNWRHEIFYKLKT